MKFDIVSLGSFILMLYNNIQGQRVSFSGSERFDWRLRELAASFICFYTP